MARAKAWSRTASHRGLDRGVGLLQEEPVLGARHRARQPRRDRVRLLLLRRAVRAHAVVLVALRAGQPPRGPVGGARARRVLAREAPAVARLAGVDRKSVV